MNDVILHLVRHGETIWNVDGRLAGWTNVELTSLGREQAVALQSGFADQIYDTVWSSDLVRAIETAELALPGLNATADARLREMNFGSLEGERWSALDPAERDEMGRFDTFRAPAGESVAELGARLEAFADHLLPGTHAVFTHGGPIRYFTQPFGERRFVPNTTVVGLRWRPARELLFVRGPAGSYLD